MRIPVSQHALGTRVGVADTPVGITRRTRPRSRASIRAKRRSCASPGTVSGWYGRDALGRGGVIGPAGCLAARCELAPFRLPGGERAAREPWRSALALSWETGTSWPEGGTCAIRSCGWPGAWAEHPDDELGGSAVRRRRGPSWRVPRKPRRRGRDASGEAVRGGARSAGRAWRLRRATRQVSGAATGRRCCRRSRTRTSIAPLAPGYFMALCARPLRPGADGAARNRSLQRGIGRRRVSEPDLERTSAGADGRGVRRAHAACGCRSTMRPSASVNSSRPSPSQCRLTRGANLNFAIPTSLSRTATAVG